MAKPDFMQPLRQASVSWSFRNADLLIKHFLSMLKTAVLLRIFVKKIQWIEMMNRKFNIMSSLSLPINLMFLLNKVINKK